MDSLIFTQSQARKIILHAAGLSKSAQFGKGKEAVFKFIDHLGFVQIDTNYRRQVVTRICSPQAD